MLSGSGRAGERTALVSQRQCSGGRQAGRQEAGSAPNYQSQLHINAAIEDGLGELPRVTSATFLFLPDNTCLSTFTQHTNMTSSIGLLSRAIKSTS